MNKAVQEIILRGNCKKRMDIAQLQIEDKNRLVSQAQGRISGVRKLFTILSAEFHIAQPLIDSLDKAGLDYVAASELEDDELNLLHMEIQDLVGSAEWEKSMTRVQSIVEEEKSRLWLDAEGTRDLDLAHGIRDGMGIYDAVFEDVRIELEVRAKAEKKRRSEPFLDGIDQLARQAGGE